jgi:hypothetical protein
MPVLSNDDFQNFGAPAAATPKILSNDDFASFGAPSVGADVAKSGAVGLGKGMINFAGTPGDASNLLAKGSKAAGDYIGGMFGAAPSPEPTGPLLPTSGGIQKEIEKHTGEFYKPQTTAGKYAGTIGETLGNPLTYVGPGGPVTKLLAGTAAGAGSEAAGQATEGTELEPAARVLGAMAAGSATSAAARGAGNAARRVPSPTTEELHTASQANYNNMKGYGVELHPHVMEQVATNIETELLNEGYRDYIPGHNQLFNAIDELRHPIGQNSTISDIDGPRRVLNRLAGNPELRDGARRAINEIDTALGNLTPADAAVNGHFIPRVAHEAVEARGNYAAFKHAEQLDNATDKAGLMAGSTGSGADIDNKTRQQIRQILTNPKKLRGFSQEEQQQMRRIVNGTFTGNAARLIGKLAPTGVVSGGVSALVGHTIGHTIGVPVIGGIAKGLSDAATRRANARLSEQVRLRSPLARRMGSTPLPPQQPTGSGFANSAFQFGIPAANPYSQ